MNILVFGDSISYGKWDREGGWVQRLYGFFEEQMEKNPKLFVLVYNLGVPGSTTEDIIERFEFEIEQRIEDDEENIIIFAVGENDSSYSKDEDDLVVADDEFEKNIIELITKAKKYSKQIIFVGLTKVDEIKTTPIPWHTDRFYRNPAIENYNGIIKEICRKNNVYFLDVFKESVEKGIELSDDGLHPSSNGHEKMFQMVKDLLVEKVL